jgi:hypothetical protein
MITYDQLQPAVRDQLKPLLQDSATAELLLQLLTAHTVLLHRTLDAEQQQLPSCSRDCGSSNACGVQLLGRQHQHSQRMHSPNSAEQHHGSSKGQAANKQPPEAVLAIAALQNGMMQLLPGGCQQYVGAAAPNAAGQAACFRDSREHQVTQQVTQARSFVFALICSLDLTFEDVPAEQQPSLNAQALQAAAVNMIMELQLVAAGVLQRQRQQGQEAAMPSVGVVGLCCSVLEQQIRALCQTSGSRSSPLVLLQQMRLLQALAASMQQLQLLLTQQQQQQQQQIDGMSGTPAMNVNELCQELQWWSCVRSPIGQVLYTFGAAASGLAARDDPHGKRVSGFLQRLGIDEVHADS